MNSPSLPSVSSPSVARSSLPGSSLSGSDITSTVRLQFHKGFTFTDAIPLVPYFSSLGISHIYSSPILTARQNSTHGYDTVDPTQINSELGGIEALKRLVAALRDQKMGLIIDIVPNHMGVGGSENPWWQHVFEWGRSSPYAFWFDIDWHSRDPHLHNRILAPFLQDPYGDVLDKGDIRLYMDTEGGRLQAHYFGFYFPIAFKDYASILRHDDTSLLDGVIKKLEAIDFQADYFKIEGAVEEAGVSLQQAMQDEQASVAIQRCLDTYNLNADSSASPDDSRKCLHELLERQHYRLTWWRNAADEINWRRFFEVSELAGVRVEMSEVFEATHSLIFSLYEQGLIDGVRLDHIDGLAHPAQYCLRLRHRFESLMTNRPLGLQMPPYIIAEKILGQHEWLRESWNLNGTTGYDFMNSCNALLHDARGAEPLTILWKRITKDPFDFSQHMQNARRQLLSENLVGELDAAVISLQKIALADTHTRDYSFAAIKRVLIEILINFPVYRSYVEADGPDMIDAEIFKLTAVNARRSLSTADKPLVDILFDWLSASLVIKQPDSEVSDLSQRAITRFQQLMPPLFAKSAEDTAFYRYGRLFSRNEVGNNPDVFSVSIEEFHQVCEHRQQAFPYSMLTTATHDHKQGEDTRARIAVISQIPDYWTAVVQEWFNQNAQFHVDITREQGINETYNAPRPWHELMLYQLLVGSWPLDLSIEDAPGLKHYTQRIHAWLIKAIREAKRMSNWMQANEGYEDACAQFVFNILDPEKNAAFLGSIQGFVNEIAAAGAINSLSQVLLRMTCPGIPDLYQGAELWDFSLSDPDNRAAVDYGKRESLLCDNMDIRDKVIDWRSGAVKQHVIQKVLGVRRESPDIFTAGSYLPLKVSGTGAVNIVAFMRQSGNAAFIIVVPRLSKSLMKNSNEIHFQADSWQDTTVHLPEQLYAQATEVCTGSAYGIYDGKIEISSLFSAFPVAMLKL